MERVAVQTIVVALILGVLSYMTARKLKIPAILFYLICGVLAGPFVLGAIDAGSLGQGLPIIVEIAVAIILFEGGLSLSPRRFRAAPSAIQRMILIVLPLTGMGAGLLAWLLLGISWRMAVVFGALIVVTGPTVIGPLLKSVSLTKRLEEILRWEAIWGDCLGVLFSALALKLLAIGDFASAGALGMQFLSSILLGTLLGAGGGFILARLILPWTSRLGDPSLPGIISVAVALGLFWGGNSLANASGPLATAVAGFTVSYLREETFHDIRHFKDQISILLISTLFVLLSSTIDPMKYTDKLPAILALALILGIGLRPAAVLLSMIGSRVPIRERLYTSMIGPRGIIAIATASYVSFNVAGHDRDVGIMLTATFVIIFLSGTAATLLGHPLARMLRISVTEKQSGIMIVGINPLSMSLARFASRYVPVMFVDTNQPRCDIASHSGIESSCTSALEDDLYEEALEEGYRRVLAVTPNDALNALIVQKAATHVGRNNVFRALYKPSEDSEGPPQRQRPLAFSTSFYASQAIERMEAGQAELKTMEPATNKDPSTVVFPLIEIVENDKGLKIVRAGVIPTNKSLCLVVSKTKT
jgi:NhaP-type Na+/H+ or K+/H+ antiporter